MAQYQFFICTQCQHQIIGAPGQTVCAACQHAVPAGAFSALVLAKPDEALQWHWHELTDEQFATAINRAPVMALRQAQPRMTAEQITRAQQQVAELVPTA